MAQTKKTTSTAKASKAGKTQTAKKTTARKTTSAKKTVKNTEPILIARTQKNESWQPLVKASSKSALKSQQAASAKKKSSAKKAKRKRMTDSRLAAITIASVFGALFLIVLLVFLFNAFDLKVW